MEDEHRANVHTAGRDIFRSLSRSAAPCQNWKGQWLKLQKHRFVYTLGNSANKRIVWWNKKILLKWGRGPTERRLSLLGSWVVHLGSLGYSHSPETSHRRLGGKLSTDLRRESKSEWLFMSSSQKDGLAQLTKGRPQSLLWRNKHVVWGAMSNNKVTRGHTATHQQENLSVMSALQEQVAIGGLHGPTGREPAGWTPYLRGISGYTGNNLERGSTKSCF